MTNLRLFIPLLLGPSRVIKWTFFQRLIPACESCFDDLEHKVANELLPVLFGCEVSSDERSLVSLPTWLGALNILNCMDTGWFNYALSRNSTKLLSQSFMAQIDFAFDLHLDTIYKDMY